MINRRPTGSLYIISQDDIDTIDSLLGALNLAVTQILENQKIHDPLESEKEEYSAVLEFDAQVQSIITEEQLNNLK